VDLTIDDKLRRTTGRGLYRRTRICRRARREDVR